MKQTDVSQLFSTPFGAQADSTTITTIPQAKPATGRASMLLGFSKDNGTPIAAGGTPPFLEDMNGILNMLASSARAAELGMLHPFSASYAATIGGYPSGATIAHPTIAGRYLLCTQDANSNDPSQNMTGWVDPLATLSSALSAETQRAESAEALLLPLSGGTLTGQITGSAGGIVPQIVGMTGRVVEQAFVASGNSPGVTGQEVWITFPTPFATGSVPIITLTINREPNSGFSRSVCVGNSGFNLPNLTNTGFSCQPWFAAGGATNTTGLPWTIYVRAIGVM